MEPGDEREQELSEWELWEMEQDEDLAAGSPLDMTRKEHGMKASDMIPSKYLRQEDVDGEVTVTVQTLKKVNVAQEDEAPEYKWTVKFHEYDRPMVLNSTNIKRMSKALGDDTDSWTGNSVKLFVDPDVEFAGKTTGGLRVRGLTKVSNGGRHTSDDDDVNAELAQATGGKPPF